MFRNFKRDFPKLGKRKLSMFVHATLQLLMEKYSPRIWNIASSLTQLAVLITFSFGLYADALFTRHLMRLQQLHSVQGRYQGHGNCYVLNSRREFPGICEIPAGITGNS